MKLLRRRSFALLLGGQAASAIGSWAAVVAVWGYAAYRFDSSAMQIAAVEFAWAVPQAVLGVLSGKAIDRVGPRKVLVVAQLAGAAAATPVLLFDSYWSLIVFAFLIGVVAAFEMPAHAALVPRIVDDHELVPANALLGASIDSAIVFGPVLASVAIGLAGFRAAFVVDSLTYLVGALTILPLQIRPLQARAAASGAKDRALDGLRYAARHRGLRLVLTLTFTVFVVWGAFFVIEPLYVRDVLGESPTIFALFQTVFGVGLVGTGLVIARVGDRAATRSAFCWSVLLSGIAAIAYVGTDSVMFAFVGVFLWGVDVGFFSAPSLTLLQRWTPEHMHGRVLALRSMLLGASKVIALPGTGALIAWFGLRPASFAIAALPIVAGSVGLVVLRRAAPPEPAESPYTAGALSGR